jgi:hypothetical protein
MPFTDIITFYGLFIPEGNATTVASGIKNQHKINQNSQYI